MAATVLKVPGLDRSVDILGMTAALGGESGDTITSSWTALELCDAFQVLAPVTNIANTQIVTLVVKTASSAAGAGAAVLTPKPETSVLTVTGTVTATLKQLLVAECNAIPVGHSYVQTIVSTDDASGTEVVAVTLHRKVNAQN